MSFVEDIVGLEGGVLVLNAVIEVVDYSFLSHSYLLSKERKRKENF